MRKYALFIWLCIIGSAYAAELTNVPCGSWIEMRATELEGYHFVQWSDGNTEAIRQVEVLDNLRFIAFYAPHCGEYADLPVIALYDWLLILDVKSIQAEDYYFNEDNVTWYRVKGVPDPILTTDETATPDDEEIGKGYSLTIDQSFVGTGDYYAVVDVSASPSGTLCHDLMRSVIVHYASAEAPAYTPLLEPTIVRPGEEQQLLHLDPDKPTQIMLYDMSGRLLQSLHFEAAERLTLQAAPVSGCYQMLVLQGPEHHMIRYIVTQ